MPTANELEAQFWAALKSDRTMMVGLDGVEDGHARPMTGHIEGEHGPIWFFTSRDSGIVEQLGKGHRAIATFTSKGHELFASVHGTISVDRDPAVIDRLWNRFVAAWFPDGKSDPKLVLLRLDTGTAQIWEDGSSLLAGFKLLIGSDPKKDYKEKVATVQLR